MSGEDRIYKKVVSMEGKWYYVYLVGGSKSIGWLSLETDEWLPMGVSYPIPGESSLAGAADILRYEKTPYVEMKAIKKVSYTGFWFYIRDGVYAPSGWLSVSGEKDSSGNDWLPFAFWKVPTNGKELPATPQEVMQYRERNVLLSHKIEPPPPKPEFRRQLRDLINANSRENASNTPDWILADYMAACLDAGEKLILAREEWYGKHESPGSVDNMQPDDQPAVSNTVKPKPYVDVYWLRWSTPTDKIPDYGSTEDCIIRQNGTDFSANILADSPEAAKDKLFSIFSVVNSLTVDLA